MKKKRTKNVLNALKINKRGLKQKKRNEIDNNYGQQNKGRNERKTCH